MTGSGKSCLAAAALDNKQLLIEKFKVSIAGNSAHDICIYYFDMAYVVRHFLPQRPRFSPRAIYVICCGHTGTVSDVFLNTFILKAKQSCYTLCWRLGGEEV
jgi:hypothetical protein